MPVVLDFFLLVHLWPFFKKLLLRSCNLIPIKNYVRNSISVERTDFKWHVEMIASSMFFFYTIWTIGLDFSLGAWRTLLTFFKTFTAQLLFTFAFLPIKNYVRLSITTCQSKYMSLISMNLNEWHQPWFQESASSWKRHAKMIYFYLSISFEPYSLRWAWIFLLVVLIKKHEDLF